MKAKVLIFVGLMSLSSVLFAQHPENDSRKMFRASDRVLLDKGHRGPADGLNLTAEQKEAFKQSMLAEQKALLPIRNELREAEAHQVSLMTVEKPDMKAIDKNIEKIGELKIQMEKIQAKHRLDLRSQLTEEQRLKFDLFKGQMMHGQKDQEHFGMPGR